MPQIPPVGKFFICPESVIGNEKTIFIQAAQKATADNDADGLFEAPSGKPQ